LGGLLLTATALSWPGWGQRAEPDAKTHAAAPAADTGRQSGSGNGSTPDSHGLAQEDVTRRQVDESERLRTMHVDAQSAAIQQAAQAMAEENRLSAEQSAALDRLKNSDAAVNEATQSACTSARSGRDPGAGGRMWHLRQ
jgi:hypothetical protein